MIRFKSNTQVMNLILKCLTEFKLSTPMVPDEVITLHFIMVELLCPICDSCSQSLLLASIWRRRTSSSVTPSQTHGNKDKTKGKSRRNSFSM